MRKGGMKKYLVRRERDLARRGRALRPAARWCSLAFVLFVFGMFVGAPAGAQNQEGQNGEAPAPGSPGAPSHIPTGEPLCQLTQLARTALQAANHGMSLMDQLEKSIDDRLSESKSAFKTCEQDEACRGSSRLRDLEEAFNQAHTQKQRMASAHNEAVQRKAELETRFGALKNQAMEAGCRELEAPNTAQ